MKVGWPFKLSIFLCRAKNGQWLHLCWRVWSCDTRQARRQHEPATSCLCAWNSWVTQVHCWGSGWLCVWAVCGTTMTRPGNGDTFNTFLKISIRNVTNLNILSKVKSIHHQLPESRLFETICIRPEITQFLYKTKIN